MRDPRPPPIPSKTRPAWLRWLIALGSALVIKEAGMLLLWDVLRDPWRWAVPTAFAMLIFLLNNADPADPKDRMTWRGALFFLASTLGVLWCFGDLVPRTHRGPHQRTDPHMVRIVAKI